MTKNALCHSEVLCERGISLCILAYKFHSLGTIGHFQHETIVAKHLYLLMHWYCHIVVFCFLVQTCIWIRSSIMKAYCKICYKIINVSQVFWRSYHKIHEMDIGNFWQREYLHCDRYTHQKYKILRTNV